MGISRNSRHKHRATGGRMPIHQKKRKFELGRPPAMTKLGTKRLRVVRCRGGNIKYRALRLETGNFSWGSENISRKCRILDVVYNPVSNEMVRTKTLVKNTIVVIDATPFKTWFLKHYGVDIGKKKGPKKGGQDADEEGEEAKKSGHVIAKLKNRQSSLHDNKPGEKKESKDPLLEDEFASGRLLACIASRPGQCGRADGYVLEGDELAFYRRKLEKKKKG
ncbi:unnamed protein product [Vitrella brassicaformis CCMP3155]|uniref:40S ribosomal protein S8 n=2 Tax=Vitrella brassicaformis TaxID=1169539 RepID=A0A0G4H468_VITBC|nr:unnamed protein product [Vitrella brassicaformis CCMP3155]|eukprot:CEM38366.1 unnamed protein product [Vitrella brassicaformis CCMP3155]